MPLTLKPFVITRRLIDSNSVNILRYTMTTMFCGVTTKRLKTNGARYLPISKEKITNSCLSKTFDG